MVNELMVELSRWQFAATSLYHFIFVPLTLGISWLVFIMELVYVATNNVIYRDMAKFWGKLFGINFAIGVATGITLEFEFGTNWSNYSHYVGDIFGAPLALEGLMAFFLESTMIGLMFTGWTRFNKKTHLLVTFLTALGSNFSAMWILIANGWMQYPEFAVFSAERMRMEMVDFWGLVFSDVAQVKFLHTVVGGYTTAAVFVVGVSAFLMLKRKCLGFAKRSMTIAVVFGLCAMGGAGLSGDLAALQITEHQPAKLAAMEAEYHTQEAPASWSIVAIPDEEAMENMFSIPVPGLLGIIATHSLDTEVKGLRDIVAENEVRVRNGILANRYLQLLRKGEKTEENLNGFKAHQDDLGYGLLLVQHAKDPLNPTEDEIKAAARGSVPPVFISFYAFRVMMGIVGVMGLLFLITGFFLWYTRDLQKRTRILKALVWAIPLPFIACEAGWIVAEIGRQPWAIQDILPTFLATSSLSPWDIALSLCVFVGIYTIFLIIEMKLMVKAIKAGPTLTDPEPEGKGYPPLPPGGGVPALAFAGATDAAVAGAATATAPAPEEEKKSWLAVLKNKIAEVEFHGKAKVTEAPQEEDKPVPQDAPQKAEPVVESPKVEEKVEVASHNTPAPTEPERPEVVEPAAETPVVKEEPAPQKMSEIKEEIAELTPDVQVKVKRKTEAHTPPEKKTPVRKSAPSKAKAKVAKTPAHEEKKSPKKKTEAGTTRRAPKASTTRKVKNGGVSDAV